MITRARLLLGGLLVVLGATVLALVCATPWQDREHVPGERVVALAESMESKLEEWQEVRGELSLIHERLRRQYRDLPDPIVVAVLQRQLEQTQRRRQRLDAQLIATLEQMLALDPHHAKTLEAKDRVLEPLCDEVRLLVAYRQEHARHLYYDDPDGASEGDSSIQSWPTPAAVRFRAEMTALAAIEEELGAAFTVLQQRFPTVEAVRELDRDVVGWHYKQLIRTLGRHLEPHEEPLRDPSLDVPAHTGSEGAEAGSGVTNVNRELLLQLERMKHLYPHSPFTRRAEQWIIQATAKRQLADLQGWPLAMLLALATLLAFGFIRCLTSYLSRRQGEEEPMSDSRIIRPASWVVTTSFASGRQPHPINRPPTPPSVGSASNHPE